MSRAPRTTKKQKEHIISALEQEKMLLGGKINPMLLEKVNKAWQDLSTHLNQLGPQKTVRQWKDVISEMKTNVRRRARNIKYGHCGTGGGAPVKPLTDLEERFLGIISNLPVEGIGLVEAGEVSSQEFVDENIDYVIVDNEISVLEQGGPQSMDTGKEIVENVVEYNILADNKTPTETPRTRKCRTRPGIRKRGNRVEAAMSAHDKTLQELTKSNFAIANSITLLAKAINNVARKFK